MEKHCCVILAFFEHGEYNVISVDWGKLARSPCYVQATYNVEAAGKCTALLIEVMVKNHKMPMKNIHVIGFSLGAQVTGQVAKYLRDRGMGKLRRITGDTLQNQYFYANNQPRETHIC
jgi:pimeloyl-ACP methyl ester carboxylesterase